MRDDQFSSNIRFSASERTVVKRGQSDRFLCTYSRVSVGALRSRVARIQRNRSFATGSLILAIELSTPDQYPRSADASAFRSKTASSSSKNSERGGGLGLRRGYGTVACAFAPKSPYIATPKNALFEALKMSHMSHIKFPVTESVNIS